MNRPHVLLGLRIAITAVCVTVAVLLCLLWGQSFQKENSSPTNLHGHSLRLHAGQLLIDETLTSVPQLSVDSNFELDDGTGRWGVLWTRTLMVPRYTLRLLPLAACSLLLAACSWLPVKRFSLRTLLIATTLVAALLGLIVSAVGVGHDYGRAIIRVREIP